MNKVVVSKLLIALFIITGISNSFAQKTIQEKLGYSKEAKLLIIHADDFGMCHSENRATIKAMEDGVVNSASIMVPCPWFMEAAQYTKKNPHLDIGIHLTVTNEWGRYKWAPVSPDAPSMRGKDGYMHEECIDVSTNATIEDVETELRAQIEKAIANGVNPTHFDSHMGCLFWNREDIFQLYIALGKEYKVPVLLNPRFFSYMTEGKDYSKSFLKYLDDEELVVAKKVMMDPGKKTREDLFDYYTEELVSLEAGLNVMLVHVGYNDEELRGITARAKIRQWDLEYYTSEECRKLLKDKNIKLVTWKEVGEVM